VGRPLDPGPPLTPDPEFCSCEPPSGTEYAKASGMTVLAVLLGGLGWFLVVLVTQRLWGFTTVIVGVAAGWAINQAAGRHRSVTLGAMSAGATLFAAATGYALLWLPFVGGMGIDRQLSWYDLIMSGLGCFVAYRLAGPKAKANDLAN